MINYQKSNNKYAYGPELYSNMQIWDSCDGAIKGRL